MKFLPLLRPTALLLTALTLAACATPANRRQLYNTSDAKSGVWHDYDRRRKAEAETGISAGTAPSVLPGSMKPTTPPPAGPAAPAGVPGPLPPGSALPAAPSLQEPLTPSASSTIPNVDVAPPPTTTDNAVIDPVAPPQ